MLLLSTIALAARLVWCSSAGRDVGFEGEGLADLGEVGERTVQLNRCYPAGTSPLVEQGYEMPPPL
jgi:hypothetical protein